MFKKITIVFVLISLLSLGLSSAALAQDDQPPQPGGIPRRALLRGQRLIGEITSLGEGQISLHTARGDDRAVRVNAATQYRDTEKNELTFADLQVDRWVMAFGPRGGEDFMAKLVILLPEDFDPAELDGRKLGGKVLEVDTVESSFTLQTRSGEQLVIAVDESTRYNGEAQALEELQPGMVAAVIAEEEEEGALLARRVAARWPVEKRAGTLKAVDPGAGEFTLTTRQGEELTYLVDEQTRFRSRQDTIAGLEELQEGMLAVVISRQPDDGERIAVLVLAGEEGDLPEFDQRFIGKVVEVGEDEFTLETRGGEQVSLQVNADTLFRSPLNKVSGLGELKEGMLALVMAQEIEDGEYLAVRVVAGRLAWLRLPRLWRAP